TSEDATKPVRPTPSSLQLPPAAPSHHTSTPVVPIAPAASAPVSNDRIVPIGLPSHRRRIYFEDVEVRRSRAKGIACRVTLRKGDETFVGEAEGMENERIRIELAARAALSAMRLAEGGERQLAFEG